MQKNNDSHTNIVKDFKKQFVLKKKDIIKNFVDVDEKNEKFYMICKKLKAEKKIIKILKNNWKYKFGSVKFTILSKFNEEKLKRVEGIIEKIEEFFKEFKNFNLNQCIQTIMNFLYLINIYPNNFKDSFSFTLYYFLTTQNIFYNEQHMYKYINKIFKLEYEGCSINQQSYDLYINNWKLKIHYIIKSLDTGFLNSISILNFFANFSKYYLNNEEYIAKKVILNIKKYLKNENLEHSILKPIIFDSKDYLYKKLNINQKDLIDYFKINFKFN